MPAKDIHINLLGQEDLGHTPWGRMITWATTYGRYIMITTEIVVLLAFISRFSLDRKLTDLTEEVTQKQAILDANADFEQEIKTLQDNTAAARKYIESQRLPVELVVMLETMLPSDVRLTSVEVANNTYHISAIAGTTAGFSQFLANLSANPKLTEVSLGDVIRQPEIGISFEVSANLPNSTGKAKK